MSLQIEPFNVRERASFFDVIAVHRQLTDVMDECRLLKYEAVVRPDSVALSYQIRDLGDPQPVGVFVPLEPVDLG